MKRKDINKFYNAAPQIWSEIHGQVEIEQKEGKRQYFANEKRVGFQKIKYLKEGMPIDFWGIVGSRLAKRYKDKGRCNDVNFIVRHFYPLDFDYGNLNPSNLGIFFTFEERNAHKRQHTKFWRIIEYLDKEFLQLDEKEKEIICEHLLNMDNRKLERFIKNWVWPKKFLRNYMEILQNGYVDNSTKLKGIWEKRLGPVPIWICVVCGGKFEARQKRLICSPECKNQRHKEALIRQRIKNSILRGAHKKFRRILKGEAGILWSDIYGYDSHELYVHLESQFTSKMSWDNYDVYWVIDHVIPRRLFNQGNKLELLMCWALPNLQPMKRHKNDIKGGKIDYYSEEFYSSKLEEIRQFVKERF